jgi:hypothetical protein
MEYMRNCPSCGKEISYKSAQTFQRGLLRNKPCRSCTMKKDYDESLIATCSLCGKTRSYSNKYNANSARIKGSCSSCSRSKANEDLWKNPEFRERRSRAATERWHTFWSDPQRRKDLGSRTSKRNVERWKDDSYRDAMIGKLLDSARRYGHSRIGHYKGFLFRSTKELNFMLKLDAQHRTWVSCENAEYAIRYMYRGSEHTYYPDFRVDDEIFEIKPRNRFSDEIVLAKKAAAEVWCEERGLKYVLHDPGSLSSLVIESLKNDGIIHLCESPSSGKRV